MPADVLNFPAAASSISLRAEGSRGIIDIRGPIGLDKVYEEEYGIEAGGTVSDFERQLSALGDVREIELNIYSYGGEVFCALAIQSILARHPARVVANVDGIAASAATIILMGADEIRMAANSYLMIHNASLVVWGDYRVAEKAAADLRKWSRDIANLYAARIEDNTGASRADILADVIAKMDAETWLTGEEAQALGLVETVTGSVALAACAVPLLTPAMAAQIRRGSVPEAIRPLLFDTRAESMSEPTAPAADAAEVVETPAVVAAVEAPETSETGEPPALPAAPAAAVEPVVAAPVNAAPSAGVTLDQIREVVNSAVQPLAERLATAEAALANEQSLRAAGVPTNAWGNQRPAETAEAGATTPDLSTLTAHQKMKLGRERMQARPSVAPAH